VLDAITHSWLWLHMYLIITLALPALIPITLFQVLPLLVLLERRGASFIQDRVGPNRAFIPVPVIGRIRGFGIIYTMTDLVKGLFKENFTPPFAYKSFYWLAPAIPVATAVLTPALVPWFAPIVYQDGSGDHTLAGTLIPSSNGLLVLFAMGALSVYGVVLGSWASNSKYSLLGGMRASAMMISYEVSMGLSVLGMLLIVGSFSLTDIVEWQSRHTWGILVQPVGFFLFMTAMFAETNRNPFDVAEGESEIIAGFHTEFAGVKFMLFMMGEYFHMLIASALMATIYFGGYDVLPFPVPTGLDFQNWARIDTSFIKQHLGGMLCLLLAVKGVAMIGFAGLVNGRRTNYARRNAQDRDLRLKEYAFYIAVFGGGGIACIALGAACALFISTQSTGNIGRDLLYPGWVNALAALVQFGIVLGKTLAFCLLFIWVRWTLPRFRYDQIMAIGWKILLNVALVNLLVTAIVAKAIR
jgi:NADH-quinone oxidoreductase subunit H